MALNYRHTHAQSQYEYISFSIVHSLKTGKAVFLLKQRFHNGYSGILNVTPLHWIRPMSKGVGGISVAGTLRWRHNGHDSISNHQPHDCSLNCLLRCRSKKTSKFCVTGLCVGNSPGNGEFPSQFASNVENVSIWWRHHGGWSVDMPDGN